MSGGRWYEEPIETVLRDGTRALVRMVEAGDKEGFAEAMGRLSSRSRYLRFHSGVEQLSERQLQYLTEVDQRDHVAWVALTTEQGRDVGIGVARFVRVEGEPDVAEAAITVLDDYQNRGLGTVLLGVLAAAAARRGITVFRSYVLGDNTDMLNLFEALGARRSEVEPGVYQVDMPIPETLGRLTDTAVGKVLRAVTGRRLPHMRTTTPPVWVSDERAAGAEAPLLRDWFDKMLDRTLGGPSRGRHGRTESEGR
jgi:GNAT superfamily N-acetyltransferase